jgi:hypothetical protein
MRGGFSTCPTRLAIRIMERDIACTKDRPMEELDGRLLGQILSLSEQTLGGF